MSHPICDVVKCAGHDDTAVGEPQERDISEILVQNDVHDVTNVRGEVDARAREM